MLTTMVMSERRTVMKPLQPFTLVLQKFVMRSTTIVMGTSMKVSSLHFIWMWMAMILVIRIF